MARVTTETLRAVADLGDVEMTGDNVQYDFLTPVHEQAFETWKQTVGARHILRHCYIEAAPFGARFKATGRRVSVKLIWELVRDRYHEVRIRCARRGIKPSRIEGYAMPNAFTPYVARHIESRRPEWAGMFVKQPVGHVHKSRGVIFIPNKKERTA